MVLSSNVNTSINKLNMNRKNKSIPVSLYGSQRSLDFHLHLDVLWPQTATTTDMMYSVYWESCLVKMMKRVNFSFSCCSPVILPY